MTATPHSGNEEAFRSLLGLLRPDFLDLALVYALMNFIGVIAVLRFSRYGHFADLTEDETG